MDTKLHIYSTLKLPFIIKLKLYSIANDPQNGPQNDPHCRAQMIP